MSNANRSKGSAYETALVKLLNEADIECWRLPISSPDGDIQIRGLNIACEAKNQAANRLGTFIRQAKQEATHRESKHWLILQHVAGNGDLREDLAHLRVGTLIDLLQLAIRERPEGW